MVGSLSLSLLGMCSRDEAAGSFVGEQADAGRDGLAWTAHEGERDTAPFRSMFAVATDAIDRARDVADVALYVAFRRTIKPLDGVASQERVIGSFPMVRHPDLAHPESDAHWRDVHGPLALASHSAMCDYDQLSIVACLQGPELDGVAMCAFPDRRTLSERFFDDDAAKAAIIADVSTFADTRASWPRVVLRQTH